MSLESASSDTSCLDAGDTEGTKEKEVGHYANAADGLGNMKMELEENEPLKVIEDLNKSHFDASMWGEAKSSRGNRRELETANVYVLIFQETSWGDVFLTEHKLGTAWPSQPSSTGSRLWSCSDCSVFLMSQATAK